MPAVDSFNRRVKGVRTLHPNGRLLDNAFQKRLQGKRQYGDRYVKENGRSSFPHLGKDTWFIGSKAEINLKEKIERLGKPLKEWDIAINYGVKTGYNSAFIIDNETKEELIAEDANSAENHQTNVCVDVTLNVIKQIGQDCG